MLSSRPIRLLLNVHPKIWGGTEAFTVRLIKHLDPRRFQCHVYSSEHGLSAIELANESLRTFTPPSGTIDELAFIQSLLSRLEIDVVHAHFLNTPLALAAKSAAIPVLWRMGGHVNVIMKGCRTDEKKRALAVVAMLADHIVCASEFLASQFGELCSTVPMSTIHNGVDVDRIAAEATDARSSGEPLTIGLVGHIIPQKGHMDLLAVAPAIKMQYPASRFRFFGAAYPSEQDALYLQRVNDLARRLGVNGSISIEHCKQDRFKQYAKVDMMVFPGLNEGCSNGILEAMALGLPVIAANSGGNPELIEHEKSGILVTPKNPQRLAETILLLASNGKMRKEIGAAAQVRARERFDIANCAARYSTIYETLARR